MQLQFQMFIYFTYIFNKAYKKVIQAYTKFTQNL